MNIEVLTGIAGGLLIFLSVLGCGWLLIGRYLQEKFGRFPISFLSAFAIGFGAIGFSFYLLYALISTPNVFIILLLLLPGFIVSYFPLKFVFYHLYKLAVQLFSSRKNILYIIILLLILLFSFILIINTLGPTKLGDAIEGYMFTAKYLYANGLEFNAYNTKYSSMPFLTELIYSISFCFNTDIAAKFFDALCGFLLLGALFWFAKTYSSTKYALIAVAFVIIQHEFVWLFGGGKIDNPSNLILFISFILLFQNSKSNINKTLLLLSIIIMGIAVNQRLTAIFYVPLFLIYLVIILKNFQLILRWFFICAIIWFFLMLPHFARNYLWTGNPFAPIETFLFRQHTHIEKHWASDSTLLSLKDKIMFLWILFFKRMYFSPIILLGLIVFIKYFKRQNAIIHFTLFSTFILVWLIAFDWISARFIFFPILFITTFGVAGLYKFSKNFKWFSILIGVYTIFFLGYNMFKFKRYLSNIKFVAGMETKAFWHENRNPRCVNLLENFSQNLNDSTKLFIYDGGISLYIPIEKIKFTSPDSINYLFENENESVDFLINNNYKYVLLRHFGNDTTDKKYDWLHVLKIVDNDNCCTIYEL